MMNELFRSSYNLDDKKLALYCIDDIEFALASEFNEKLNFTSLKFLSDDKPLYVRANDGKKYLYASYIITEIIILKHFFRNNRRRQFALVYFYTNMIFNLYNFFSIYLILETMY